MVNARGLRFQVLLFVVLLGAMSCKSSMAPTGRATLSGIITDSSTGAAVAAVTVALQGKSATTGSDGRYSIADLLLGTFTVTLKHQGHDNVSQTITLTDGSNQVSLTITPAVAARFQGTWSGSWVNPESETGGASLVITIDTVGEMFQATFDLNGIPYEKTDPPAETFSGPYTPGGELTFTKTKTYYGDVTFTLAVDGKITGSVARPPADFPKQNVTSIDITGTATEQKMTIRVFVVRNDGEPPGATTITLNKL